MSGIKHTPGPWRIEPQRHGAAYYDVPILADAASSAVALACDLYSKDGGVLTRDANARLIAAAPELFVVADHPVMKWLLTDGIDNIPEPQRTSLRLFLIPLHNAAIAKATGATCEEVEAGAADD